MTTLLTLIELERNMALCKTHLEQTQCKGTEIEAFLTQFLLVSICGEYEKEIKRIVIERAQRSGDDQLVSYIERSLIRVRNIKVKEIREKILDRFSDNCLTRFNAKVIGTESETRYSNIVYNRDSGAHGGTINMTFDELLMSYDKAKSVINAVSEALS